MTGAVAAIGGTAVGLGVFLLIPGRAHVVTGTAGQDATLQTSIESDVGKSLERVRQSWLGTLPLSQPWWFVTSIPGQPVVTGAFAFVADPNHYQDRLTTNQASIGLTSYDVAYDGTHFQALDKTDSVLNLRGDDPGMRLTAVPHPLMLTWEFLSRDDDACPLCDLRPVHLTDPAILSSRLSAMTVLSHDEATGTTVVQLPGGIVEGNAFVYQVTLVGEAGRQVPSRIRRVLSTGQVLTEVEFLGYGWAPGPDGALILPFSITMRSYMADGNASVSYGLVEPRGDTSAWGDAPFTIDPSVAEHVWDTSAGTFVR